MKVNIEYICKLVELIQRNTRNLSSSGRRRRIPLREGYIVVLYASKRGRGAKDHYENYYETEEPLPLTKQITKEGGKIRYTTLWKILEYIFVDVQYDGRYLFINIEMFNALATYCALRNKLIETRQPF